MKQIIKYLLLLIILSIPSYCIYRYEVDKPFTKYMYFGTILKHSSDEVSIKHGTRTELYLLIRFDSLYITKAIEVSPTTYLDNKDGDKVCFSLQKQTLYPKSHTGYAFFGMILEIIIGSIIIILLLYFLIKWIFPDFISHLKQEID